ncbi:FAD:protein FMN transferase [Parafrankia soli]|uniref:FAD:protein FMN transferase n=1 Tax=Parafrankia soli TaxID=2599596 RepID=UPI003B845A50
MGTVVSIDVRSPLDAVGLDAAIGAAVRVLHRVDEDFSTFRATSWVSRLRRGEIELGNCPDHVREVYRAAAECREQTGGWFDPAWRGDGTLEPTGLVKGWAADAASTALTAAGAPSHCVSAAGDLRVRGTSGWAPTSWAPTSWVPTPRSRTGSPPPPSPPGRRRRPCSPTSPAGDGSG